MEIISNILEYYDELYSVSEEQKVFFRDLLHCYSQPARLLRVGCGTGLFEHLLAREGYDVTGIEDSNDFLRSANLRRRNQLMSIRFFKMSYLDMTRFLGKGFYNVISSLDNQIIKIHDKTLMRKFFFDCSQLLCANGVLVLQLYNYNQFNAAPLANLPERKSLRSKLFTELWSRDDGSVELVQNVETGSGKLLPVIENEKVYPILPQEIQQFSTEASFSSVEFYSDYTKTPFSSTEKTLVALIKK